MSWVPLRKEPLGFYTRTVCSTYWDPRLLSASVSVRSPGWTAGPRAFCHPKDQQFMGSCLGLSSLRAQPAAHTAAVPPATFTEWILPNFVKIETMAEPTFLS